MARRINLLFVTLLIISVLAGAEIDLFAPSLPELQETFGLSLYAVQAIISVNFIAYCIGCLLVGVLGDRFNRKKVMLYSLLLFVVGSILCSVAINYYVLLLGRFIQGFGIAAPSILGFVIISDNYPIERQSALLGIFNSIVTFSMAFAPIIGSYINYLFNWRANFFVLLGISVVACILSLITIPSTFGNKDVKINPMAYLPLFKSKDLIILMIGICLLVAPYWSFVAISPILYIDDLSVSVQYFGYYQGAIGMSFAVASLFIGGIEKMIGGKKCLYSSLYMYVIGVCILLYAALSNIRNPLIITIAMIVICIAGVYPLNIMNILTLQFVNGAKSRTAALINGLRLVFTVFVINSITFFYKGDFLPVGIIFSLIITMFLFLTLFMLKGILLNNQELTT